jgi:hypothetical protein
VLLAASVIAIIWLAITFGGAALLGTYIAAVFGWVCFIFASWPPASSGAPSATSCT